MAKCIVTFRDLPDGTVRTSVKFDPHVENDGTPMTPAVAVAMQMLEAMHERMKQEEAAN